MKKLAINGGGKIRKTFFPAYKTIGNEEIESVKKVLETGVLSRFLGCWEDDFFGGPQVKALEEEWAAYFGVKHAIAVNSATSGLYCAMGATGVGPGDEVIVSPYTMTASAVSPLIYNAIPVFADIEEDYFCLSPESVENKITEKTKAIIVVDIFGLPYEAEIINKIAKEKGILVIEDVAQAPGAKYGERFAGTLGDIGVFSLNYHKHIHCGEGGIVVTDNDGLADRVRLIRNHAEAVVEGMGFSSLVNMVGFNYRMTEIEAAITREQLKKLDHLVKERQNNVKYLNNRLNEIPCLQAPKTRNNCEHVYYVQPIKYDMNQNEGIIRERFVEAVKAELMPTDLRETEGIGISGGYVRPLYLQPIFQKMEAYGDKGCPFTCAYYNKKIEYKKGICPTCEELHFEKMIINDLIRPPMSKRDLDDVAEAFVKVWENRKELL